MTLIAALDIIGLNPAHPLSLYYPIAVIAIWILVLPLAYLRRIRIFYNSSLRAAFLEEIIYRGCVYGLLIYFLKDKSTAFIITTLVFGLGHMRNVWWAGWKRSWRNSVYAGLVAGPIFGLVRELSGDIYLGILIHFLHNLFVMFPLPGLKGRVAPTPTDAELRERR